MTAHIFCKKKLKQKINSRNREKLNRINENVKSKVTLLTHLLLFMSKFMRNTQKMLNKEQNQWQKVNYWCKNSEIVKIKFKNASKG